jgi:hypothetical protein
MRFGNVRVRVMQQRAGEVRIGAAMDGSTGSDSGAEQVRANGDAYSGARGLGAVLKARYGRPLCNGLLQI